MVEILADPFLRRRELLVDVRDERLASLLVSQHRDDALGFGERFPPEVSGRDDNHQADERRNGQRGQPRAAGQLAAEPLVDRLENDR